MIDEEYTVEEKNILLEESVLQKRYDAILFLDFNRPIESMELFEQTIALDENNVNTYNELGLIFYSRFKQYEDAVFYYKKALAIDATLFFTHYQYAVTLQAMGYYEEAVDEYMLAIEYGEDSYFICKSYFAIIDIYSQDSNKEEVIEELYAKALEVLPEYFAIYYHRAVYFYRKTIYEKVLENIVQCLEYNPYYVKALYLLSLFYAKKEDWSNAVAYADKAQQYSEFHPVYTDWYTTIEDVYTSYLAYTHNINDIALFLYSLEKVGSYTTMERVISEYSSSIESEDSVIQQAIHRANAVCFLYYGFLVEAITEVQSALALDTTVEAKIALYFLQARIYESLQEYSYALESYYFCYSFVSEEEQISVAVIIAKLYTHLAMFNEALEWYYQAYMQDSDNVQIAYEYSCTFFTHNMVKEGIEALSILRELPIQNDIIFRHCVELLYSNKAYRECIRWCELWKRYNPSNYLSYYYSACARYARQYLQDALESAQSACRLSPSNSICRDTLRAIQYAIADREKDSQRIEEYIYVRVEE